MANQSQMEKAVEQLLINLDENISRPGLLETPKRVAKSMAYLTSGQKVSAEDVVNGAIFPCESKGLVLQKDIEFYSLCEHHLLPFFGKVHVAYLPNQKIIGLSKVGRIVDVFAKRLQVQENLTHQIAHAIEKILKPKGVAVTVEASHFCMMMRGVQKLGCTTQTNEFIGAFEIDFEIRREFFQSIKK